MNRELLETLLALAKRDEETRARLLEKGALYGDYAEEMQRVHRANAERLNQIIDEHGWPGVSEVGEAGSRAAWLIAQHAICTPELQRKFHAYLTRASERGEAPTVQVAYLTDRIRFHEGRPQVYGTVFDWNEEGELSCELEDSEAVDIKRREVGLPPFADDLRRHREEVRAEGGGPPEDYRAYRRKVRDWARRVGWR
ncbi:MAG: DUF6624 domain-containing protein [Gammaproteobacteria bacterium]|nr:DUF6624 domain-containing protein [Gammaproteobacteria bacterium]